MAACRFVTPAGTHHDVQRDVLAAFVTVHAPASVWPRHRTWHAGWGNGARVAAVVAGRCRGHVAGCCMLSYPLLVSPPMSLAICICCLDLQCCYICFTSLCCMQEPPQPTKSAKAKLGQPTVKPQDSVSSCLHALHD